MQNLSKTICARIRDARRQLGLTQTELADEVGCKQSALSLFEAGNTTKLSEDIVQRIARRLNVDIKENSEKEEAAAKVQESRTLSPLGYCPVHDCPSNTFYTVGGRGYYRVTLQAGRYCAHCGEVLEKCCPHCGAPLNAGACCSSCGQAYVQG